MAARYLLVMCKMQFALPLQSGFKETCCNTYHEQTKRQTSSQPNIIILRSHYINRKMQKLVQKLDYLVQFQ